MTSTLGIRFVERLDTWWALTLFLASLAALVGSLGSSALALWPREYLTLGMAYLRRFPTWGEILKEPSEVRGATMNGLIEAIARERETNDAKVLSVRRAFLLLMVGVLLIAIEGATLAIDEVIG